MDVDVERVFRDESTLDRICKMVGSNPSLNYDDFNESAAVNVSTAVPLSQTCEDYECDCSQGVLLPVWGGNNDREYCFDISAGEAAGRSMLYFIFLLYCFLGVSIVADRFMSAIEVITSQKREVSTVIDGVEQRFKVLIWNETVANLTLMALGSSAPEILLSIIEIVGNDFEAGELGPATIVGSAAFNMFVIFAICVMVIPSSETRKIRELPVFFLTAATSIFAYVWLFIIVRGSSENEITVWEAVITFLFFPALVTMAFMVDRKFFISKWRRYRLNQRRVVVAENVEKGDVHFHKGHNEAGDDAQTAIHTNGTDSASQSQRRKEEISMASTALKSQQATLKGIDKETVRKFAAYQLLEDTPKSRAFYRVNAIRRITGSRGVLPVQPKIDNIRVRGASAEDTDVPLSVGFVDTAVSVMENAGSVTLKVRRDGDTNCKVQVHYYTEDKEAKAGDDYEAVKDGILLFGVGETEKTITINIIDDDIFEETETFYVKLRNVVASSADSSDSPTPTLKPDSSVAIVTILDDDHHGRFVFEHDKYSVEESAGYCTVSVVREMGARGSVSIPIMTKPGTAKGKGDDYEDIDEILHFGDGESRKEIRIRIIDDEEYEKDEEFYVFLGEPTEVDTVPASSGGPDPKAILGECCKTTVTIKECHEFKNDIGPDLGMVLSNKHSIDKHNPEEKILMGHVTYRDGINWTIMDLELLKFLSEDAVIKIAALRLKIGSNSWWDQIMDCFYVNGKPDWSETETLETRPEPSMLDYALHIATFPWKLLFALVPPSIMLGGWACFVVAIIFIGILTALIGDLASSFGCSAGLNADVTAITFVALGTSLPDAFASKTAATQDKYADGSLGNVTGSNSVNVFLGLGLAWLLASIYHAANGTTFEVVGAESLGFSVVIFCIFAIICVVILMVRRFLPFIGAELGGPMIYKIITASIFVFLWVLYIILSSLVSYEHIKSF